MPVPALWTDIFDVAASNSPAGSEAVGPNMNAYLQAAFAYCKQLYEGQQNPTANVPMNAHKITGLANGTVATDAAAFGQLAAYLPLIGGTISGAMTFNGTTSFSNTSSFSNSVTFGNQVTMNNIGLTINASGTSSFVINSSAGSVGANIKLLDSQTGTQKYVRCSANNFQVVNGAYNATPLSMDDSGNLVVTGNVTAFSDERLKTDWALVGSDFVVGLAALKSGTYTRTDIKQRQAGVSAQGLQKLLPEAISKSDDGYFGVAYGQAAMVACVELAKEVQALRRRISELEYRQ